MKLNIATNTAQLAKFSIKQISVCVLKAFKRIDVIRIKRHITALIIMKLSESESISPIVPNIPENSPSENLYA